MRKYVSHGLADHNARRKVGLRHRLRYFRNSARSNFQSLIATLSLSALVVHLLKPVVALVVTPIDEDGTVIDAGAILAPTFEAYMGGG